MTEISKNVFNKLKLFSLLTYLRSLGVLQGRSRCVSQGPSDVPEVLQGVSGALQGYSRHFRGIPKDIMSVPYGVIWNFQEALEASQGVLEGFMGDPGGFARSQLRTRNVQGVSRTFHYVSRGFRDVPEVFHGASKGFRSDPRFFKGLLTVSGVLQWISGGFRYVSEDFKHFLEVFPRISGDAVSETFQNIPAECVSGAFYEFSRSS